jgi:hydrogenase nickel incorporation protein HypB
MDRVEIRRKILAANDAQAALLRERFDAAGTLVVDLVSSPGAGKTSLLEMTAQRMTPETRMATVVGDIATELDAERLRRAGMPAHQIVTGGACHLDARLVTDGLEAAGFEPLELLFIENVGNLVCPASYTLGEDFKVALLSVTEGHDKPFKYPAIFARAAVTVLTKVDLLPYLDFDLEQAQEQILSLNPEAEVLLVSVKTGQGVSDWCDLLRRRMTQLRSRRALVEVP